MTNHTRTGFRPYSDGSGYEYEIEVRECSDGLTQISIKSGDQLLTIDCDKWEDLMVTIDKARSAHRLITKP